MTHDRALQEIVSRSTPFEHVSDFSALIEKFKDKKIVMFGESSHGTKEFYEWRSRLSAELIQKHGFNFISVEGDWPPCQEVNRYIQHKNQLSAYETLSRFNRWPTWMWGNKQMLDTLEWMSEWNSDAEKLIGFHGLDVYSLFDSLDEVVRQVKDIDPHMASKLQAYYSCFTPYHHDEMAYVKSLVTNPGGCSDEVTYALEELLKEKIHGREAFFDATQNATIIKNAERYYRAMVFSINDDSWNVRDRHMMDTLEMLLDHYGPDSKGIVWAHNTHVGDFQGTDMKFHGQVNIGGLARERFGKERIGLLGFTTHSGTVTASHAWDGATESMDVPEAHTRSLEGLLKKAVPLVGSPNFYLTLDDVPEHSTLSDFRVHRAIGVVYWPEHEGQSNYVPASVAERYDALAFIEKTSALVPLELDFDRHKLPDTYPFGARI